MKKPPVSPSSTPSASISEAYLRSLEMLDERYVCPLCRGVGFTLDDATNTAYACSCRPIAKSIAQLRAAGLLHAARTKTFAAFRADEPWQKHLLDSAMAFCAQEKPGWLFFGGQSGCGKTHLCTAAAVALCLAGRELRYMRWMNETTRLKALGMDERRTALMQSFIDAPLLYIDDLFKSAPTDADKHIAFELLDARSARDDRPTIISSERTLRDLFAIDEAIAGRIAEMCTQRFTRCLDRDESKNHRLKAIAQ